MTLITHLRNSRIAVIAGDSKNTSTGPVNYEYDPRKVFDFKDCIIGYYGDKGGFMTWVEFDLLWNAHILPTFHLYEV